MRSCHCNQDSWNTWKPWFCLEFENRKPGIYTKKNEVLLKFKIVQVTFNFANILTKLSEFRKLWSIEIVDQRLHLRKIHSELYSLFGVSHLEIMNIPSGKPGIWLLKALPTLTVSRISGIQFSLLSYNFCHLDCLNKDLFKVCEENLCQGKPRKVWGILLKVPEKNNFCISLHYPKQCF